MSYDVFVSYSTLDKYFVDALVHELESHGIRCWYAPRDIPPGVTWPAAITAAIENSTLMLLVFSESANASTEVAKELTLASSYKRLVLPVRIEEVVPSAELKYHLTNKHWLDVYGMEWETATANILESLRQYENNFQQPIQPSTEPSPARARQPVPAAKSNKAVWAALGAVLVLVCALGVWMLNTGTMPSPATEKADEPKDAKMQTELGARYAMGQGVPKDYAKALQWYQKAADQGYAEAQYLLGGLYISGYGVPQDYAKALQWHQKAADQGFTNAQFGLGSFYFEGHGVPKDYAKALQWYQKAADQGLANAQYIVGVMYAEGHGMPQDYVKALQWYQKAADQGNAEAQFLLAGLYEFGRGVSKDYAMSAQWYRKAADQGYANAQYVLGTFYINGWGVIQDRQKGCGLLRTSAEQGIKAAIEEHNKYCKR
jgi:TPR repeat protein